MTNLRLMAVVLSLGVLVTTAAQAQNKITVTASSNDTDHKPSDAVDGNPKTFWHTPWKKDIKQFPHELDFKLERARKVYGFVVIPRQDSRSGLINKYEIYTSRDGKKWSRHPILESQFSNAQERQVVRFKKAINTRYLKLKAISSWDEQPVAALAEFAPIYSLKRIPFKGDSGPTPNRARSVHLTYRGAAKGTLFYNELVPIESHTGTYFCACGFNMGYFGVQEKSNGQRIVIFSVWDPGNQQDATKVKKSKRVRVLYKGKGVRTGRFGGEGTGAQSFFNYKWKENEKYRFMVKATAEGDHTNFTGFFYLNKKKKWKRLVTFKTLSGGKSLDGYYSFVEDFKRNTKSFHEVRKARFGNGWVRDMKGNWIALSNAGFTGDELKVNNINAGALDDGFFFLQTGGDTIMTQLPKRMLKRTKSAGQKPDEEQFK